MNTNIDLEKKLIFLFNNVNDWLKYLETKNAVLATILGAAIFGILTLLNTKDCFIKDYKISFICLVIFLFAGIIASLISFFPLRKFNFFNEPDQNDNVFYYGSIAKYSYINYEELIKKKLNIQGNLQLNEYCEDLIKQIIINSKITERKTKIFSLNLKMIFTGIIIATILFFSKFIYIVMS
jgi:hypothetical protein